MKSLVLSAWRVLSRPWTRRCRKSLRINFNWYRLFRSSSRDLPRKVAKTEGALPALAWLPIPSPGKHLDLEYWFQRFVGCPGSVSAFENRSNQSSRLRVALSTDPNPSQILPAGPTVATPLGCFPFLHKDSLHFERHADRVSHAAGYAWRFLPAEKKHYLCWAGISRMREAVGLVA